MDRRFARFDRIFTSPEATAVWEQINADARRAMQRYRDCDAAEMQAVLDGMNARHADISDRFAYCQFFGGLVHIQLSVLAGENCWIMLPGLSAPVDRLAMQANGLVCTRAPAEALLAWEASPRRRDIPIYADGGAGIDRRECANCGEAHNLKACDGCRLVRYCSSQCQRAHWRVGHKPLCRWARACNDRQFGDAPMLML